MRRMCISGDTTPRSLIKINILEVFDRVLTAARKGSAAHLGCTLGLVNALHCNHPVTVVPIAALNFVSFGILSDAFHARIF
jgi:hypothetical protein